MSITTKTVKINPVKYFHNQKNRGRSYNKKTYVRPSPPQQKQQIVVPEPDPNYPQGSVQKTPDSPVTQTGGVRYEQKSRDQLQNEFQQQQREISQQQQNIQPFEQYQVGNETISGIELMKRLEQQKQQYAEAEKTIQDYPEGTSFGERYGENQYDVILPKDMPFRWTKKAKQDMHPVSKFIFGVSSSGASVLKPLADMTGRGPQFDVFASIQASMLKHPLDINRITSSTQDLTKTQRYGVHYSSALDPVFEPIGWAPSGATQVLTDDPVFAAGTIVGEAVVSYGMGKGISGVGFGIKSGVKSGIKFSSKKILPTISRVFPEERLATSGITWTGKQFTSKIFKTSPIKNMYRWGVKGWKKGYVLGRGDVTTIDKVPVKQGFDTSYDVIQKTPFTGNKQWLSPIKYDIAEQRIKNLLKQGKIVDINFPTQQGNRLTMLTEQMQFKPKGIFKKSIIKTYSYKRYERDLYRVKYPSIDTSDALGSLYKRGPKPPGIAYTASEYDEWYNIIKKWHSTEYPGKSNAIGWKSVDTPTEIVNLPIEQQTFHKGMGKIKPVPEKPWHQVALGQKKLKTSFWKDIRGETSLINTQERRFLYRPNKFARTTPKYTYSSSITIPAVTPSVAALPIVRPVDTTDIQLMRSTVTINKPRHRYTPEQIIRPQIGTDAVTSLFRFTDSGTTQRSIQRIDQESYQKIIPIPVVKTVTVPKPSDVIIPSKTSVPKMLFPFPKQVEGRGRIYSEWDMTQFRYKFRKVDIKSPLKGVKL